MTLVELENVLGERINKSLMEMDAEKRQEENEQSRLIVGIAKQMINNADVILRTEKLLAQTKNLKKSYAYMLVSGKNEMDS